MKHTALLLSTTQPTNKKDTLDRALGKFYTPVLISEGLVDDILVRIKFENISLYRIVDPFCGDGRLVASFLQKAKEKYQIENVIWEIHLWDFDEVAVKVAQEKIEELVMNLGLNATINAKCQDSFKVSIDFFGYFDMVITNPPWETIKPDIRELRKLTDELRCQYISELRIYDSELARIMPNSQPKKKFAGWGTNLSRCGTELSIKLLKAEGFCGIVTPLSLLMDQMSSQLRKWLLAETIIFEVLCYPAEAKLFNFVDQDTVAMILQRKASDDKFKIDLIKYGRNGQLSGKEILDFHLNDIKKLNYCIPVSTNAGIIKILKKWDSFPVIGDYESKEKKLWLGRELDETRFNEYLNKVGRFTFLKGRMIGRYKLIQKPTMYVDEQKRVVPKTALHTRIAWRDVSRRNQARRLIAAIIPPMMATGNSLHVGYFQDDDIEKLRALLAIFNSVPFEYQVRSILGTGHISLGIIRQIRIPPLENREFVRRLSQRMLDLDENPFTEEETLLDLEVSVAQAYGLKKDEYAMLLQSFEGLSNSFRERLLSHPIWAQT